MRSSKAELSVTYEQDGIAFRETVYGGTEFVMFSPESEDQESAAVKLGHLGDMVQVR